MRDSYIRQYLKRAELSDSKDMIPNHDAVVDRSNSFNLANKGELSTGEYVSYIGYLGDKRITERLLAEDISLKQFPLAKPTKKQYESLISIIERLELDLGLDSELDSD
jgi:hypothetical protein